MDNTVFKDFREIRAKINKLMNIIVRDIDSEETIALKLNKTQIQVIIILKKNKEIKMSDLTNYTNLSKSSITSIVDSLEEINLVNRIRSKSDRRVIIVKLSDEGDYLADKIRAEIRKAFYERIEKLDDEETNDLKNSLRIVNKSLDLLE
ncbi:MAG: MarR family winged helix-turn-helix transcriptional regulator [Pleomorphochaeta sp.]